MPNTKVVWCGQNSIGVVAIVNAARKLGATAVPLNYRLSDEEAAYVTDHSDAVARVRRRRVRTDVRAHPRPAPEGRDVLVFDGAGAGRRWTSCDELVARRVRRDPRRP